MDVRNWPLDRIMQLPDCAFGRRWPVCVNVLSTGPDPLWDISEVALPEKCVIWELTAWSDYVDFTISHFRLALGDQLPTTAAMMDVLEPVFSGLGRHEAEPRRISMGRYQSLSVSCLRMSIIPAGRRVVVEVTSGTDTNGRLQVVLVVSSFPTEVPDWLISGPAKSL